MNSAAKFGSRFALFVDEVTHGRMRPSRALPRDVDRRADYDAMAKSSNRRTTIAWSGRQGRVNRHD
jgi:hypothetical protein